MKTKSAFIATNLRLLIKLAARSLVEQRIRYFVVRIDTGSLRQHKPCLSNKRIELKLSSRISLTTHYLKLLYKEKHTRWTLNHHVKG